MLYRFNKFIEKWMAFVTPLCLLLGVCFPDIAKYGLPYVTYVFAFMTFAGALKSRFKDVANVLKNPTSLLMIMIMLHVVVPATACGLGHLLFPDNMNLITGMVLEFSIPTAVASMMWVSIFDGNSSLSLSLVVIDTILAPFIIPTTLHILIGSNVELDTAGMMKELLYMVALPAVAAMCLNQLSRGKIMETWPQRLAPFSKMALMFVVTSNSSKVAPYIRQMNLQRFAVAGTILCLAAGGYFLGWVIARLTKQNQKTTISMVYGTGMRNISTGAVIAAAYFPGEVMFPVMIGTLFQQILAAISGKMLTRREKTEEKA
ncbi:bile acid:sodium symporter family protein [Blautia sp. MSJ-19]|uniref:bile acid:sodium symporter family protein n=1 Tax=Blautia sp. MSJ-19 TaxID=2841517 RepID=UPI001C0F0C06|nr:bile acid:sodium symporter family protein [Blautia sp. MSJ-19]MBU5479603.1 bile acid:sodium symporter family protein [Blautia sp. MSJ-19]